MKLKLFALTALSFALAACWGEKKEEAAAPKATEHKAEEHKAAEAPKATEHKAEEHKTEEAPKAEEHKAH
jgi:ABC-type uncharacterized transport system auxiliary subunit